MSFQPKSDFLDIMMSRGFLADCTDYEGLDKALLAGGMPGYIGFDATAQSLHVGQSHSNYDVALVAKNRRTPDYADGWWHDESGRSQLSGG